MKQCILFVSLLVSTASAIDTMKTTTQRVVGVPILDNGVPTTVFEWPVGNSTVVRCKIREGQTIVACVSINLEKHTTVVTRPDGTLFPSGWRSQEISDRVSSEDGQSRFELTTLRLIFPAEILGSQTTLCVLP